MNECRWKQYWHTTLAQRTRQKSQNTTDNVRTLHCGALAEPLLPYKSNNTYLLHEESPANQKIPRISWNPKVHCPIHTNPPSVLAPTPQITSRRPILMLSSNLRLLQVVSFPHISPSKSYTHHSSLPYVPHALPIS